MRNVLRWTGFTVGAALIGLMVAFALLWGGRLYMGLQHSAFVFSALMVYCIGLTIAAIAYAAKLEEETAEADGAEVQRYRARAAVELDDQNG